jgi:DNA-binding MarR family transcriptional regulator
MRAKNEEKTVISTILQDNAKTSSKRLDSSCGLLARGVGFEPRVKPELLSKRVMAFLVSKGVSSLRDVYDALEEEPNRVDECLRRLWKRGFILRTRESSFDFETSHKGRAGITGYTRAINHYGVNNGNELPANFVKYDERKKDGRSRDVESKAYGILNYLINNKEKAFYSNDIVKELKVKSCDIMANVRRFEKKGLVYVRGYQTHDGRSPFRKGFLLTFIDQDKPRDTAIREAFERTDKMLLENPTSNTIHERVRLIRDQLLTTNEILSLSYFKSILHCDVDSAKRALRRARQLYSDIEQAKIFDRFTYYYLKSMKPEDLKANIEMKKNYIRVRFGRDNRIGHNWEACAEWFIDKFTEGAEFVSQNHRKNMDSRRITLHLLKQVGDRKQNAEVDRVWKVTPGLFSPTVTYVLECKWSIVTRKTLDDFLDVLKWSTDFGVDTESGRELKKGVVPVFAAGTYNPREKVLVNAEKITVAQHANRMNIKLLRPADFNEKLRDHGIDKRLTTQRMCRICRDEREIRELLNSIWKEPQKAQEHLTQISQMNDNVFLFEKLLNT